MSIIMMSRPKIIYENTRTVHIYRLRENRRKSFKIPMTYDSTRLGLQAHTGVDGMKDFPKMLCCYVGATIDVGIILLLLSFFAYSI